MTIPVRKNLARADWKKILGIYPRLVGCMIEESDGYFTPRMAVEAIRAYKLGNDWSCEWYLAIDERRNPGKLWDSEYDNRMKAINHSVIRNAFMGRKRFNTDRGKRIVKSNLGDHESVGAAWF